MNTIDSQLPKIPSKTSISNPNKRILSSKAYAKFFEVMETLSKPISKKRAARYQLLAIYYRDRAKSAEKSTKLFGEHLIHYGLNFENPKTLSLAPSTEKIARVINRAKEAAPSLFELREAGGKISQNLCAAATAHCAKKFYDLLEKGHSEKEAFCKASADFEEGMPAKDALIQSVLQSRSVNPQALKSKALKQKTIEKLADAENLAKLRADDKHTAKFFKLQIKEHIVSWKSRFLENFQHAQEGTYLVSFINKDNFLTGHVFLVRKNSDQSISIYDPNFGAAIIPKEKSEEYLKKLINHADYKDYNRLAFVPLNKE